MLGHIFVKSSTIADNSVHSLYAIKHVGDLHAMWVNMELCLCGQLRIYEGC